MPELPEVETVVRKLAPFLLGRKIRKLAVHDPKLDGFDPSLAENRIIDTVCRLGKQIGLELGPVDGEGDSLWLAVHLRMTGRLIIDSRRSGQNDKHLRAEFLLDEGSLLFYDTRRFGTIKMAGAMQELLGPAIDPLSRKFTRKKLHELIGSTTTPVKTWLLRQDKLVGLGNIYACEILFDSRIDPSTPAGSLSGEQVARLHRETRRVLRLAIEKCGTTFSDFQDGEGNIGGFQEFLKVYGREGLPCRDCGETIRRTVQQQRSTFFCPGCQR